MLAAGSGLYLYQVKQRAFALDASLRSTFHDIDVARERTRMLRADWALMNDPERLQGLASQYLTLQPMQPAQLLTMDQLAAALPPPVPFAATPAATQPAPAPAAAQPTPVLDPTHGVPMAEAAPMVLPHTHPVAPEVALSQLAAPQPQQQAPQLDALAQTPASAPPPPLLAMAVSVPRVAATSPKPLRHGSHHAAPQTQPWLAQASGYQGTQRRHAERHAAPTAPSRQFFAANLPPSVQARAADPTPRIIPPVATVMYSPVLEASSGSSLGMASSAALAPPRPLYSTSQ
jgi:hypothetical protein